MFRYVLMFSKNGSVKYTSHLDMQRLFKRAFRRSDVDLAYSKGFNPHPKMGFAQPLSLGYEGDGEIMDFETNSGIDGGSFIKEVAGNLPSGISLLKLGMLGDGTKSPAAALDAAEYKVYIPLPFDAHRMEEDVSRYMRQEEIITLKKVKKSKELKSVDIKSKIRSLISFETCDGTTGLTMLLDCGSRSNLSAEAVISTFLEFTDLGCGRYEIEVCRSKLIFELDYPIDWL